MKMLILTLFLSLDLLASKAKPLSLQFHLNCVTEYPTTSFISHLTGPTIKFQIRNHNGPNLIPFFSGLITPNDLPLLQQRAQLIQTLGHEAWLSFEIKNCTSYQDKSLICFGDQEITVNNQSLPLIGKGLSLSFINSQLMDQTTQETQISARIGVPNSSSGDLEVTMRYSKNECRVQL